MRNDARPPALYLPHGAAQGAGETIYGELVLKTAISAFAFA
jgi:hypothetical protein